MKYLGLEPINKLNTTMLEAWIEHLSGSLKELTTNLETERLDMIITLLGGDKNALKTNLVSEKITMIVNLMTGEQKANATLDDLIEVFSEQARAEATGTSITVNDSANLPAGLEIMDNAVGKNLLDYNNAVLHSYPNVFVKSKEILDNMQCYKIECISDKNVLAMIDEKIYWNNLKDGVSYTLSFYVKGSERIKSQGDIYINDQLLNYESYEITTEWQKKTCNFVFASNNKKGYLHFYPDLKAGQVVYYANMQIEEGTEATEYEPYGTAYIKVCNKNLLNVGDLLKAPSGELDGYPTERVLVLKGKAGTQYTLSSDGEGSLEGAGDENRCLYLENSSTNYAIFKGHPVTTYADETGTIKVGLFSSRTIAQPILNGEVHIQLEEGNTATNYVPHQEQNYEVQAEAGNKIKIETYHPTTHIALTGSVQPTLKLNYKKVIE